MSSPLEIGRVAFAREDPDDDESPVSKVSTPVDLRAHQVRGVYSPPGSALGVLWLTTAMTRDGVQTAVPIEPPLIDGDQAATLVRFKDDWPLMWTTITVERARDEPFELFFVYEHRG